MSLFAPRLFGDIMKDMLSTLLANTPLSDVNFGSIWTSMLEAAAQEDDEQYFQMLEIIRGYSLDTVTGTDLDSRAAEYSIERLPASEATTIVTIGDSAVTKVVTGVYAGLPGAVAGSTSINGNSATGFSSSGALVIGRGTTNVERVPYSSITVFPNYVTFNLGAATSKDHGTDETLIMAQGGDRVISSGVIVQVQASDTSPAVTYTLDSSATILDGESEATGVDVTCSVVGTVGNVPIGSINTFSSKPFSSVTVTNTEKVTNGFDAETDQELRDRIKTTIQSLSRGTANAIINGILGLTSATDNKRLVSVSLRDTTSPGDVVEAFVDAGGGGFTFARVGFETVVASATGGERFLQTSSFPLVKAFTETQNTEPYNIPNNGTLFITINGQTETITFVNSDFAVPGAATAQEVLRKINGNSLFAEARVTTGPKVKIFSRANVGEEINVTGGSANTALAFQTDVKYTAKLYLERAGALALLSKDGRTAAMESAATATYNLSFSGVPICLALMVDGRARNVQTVWFDSSTLATPTAVDAQTCVDLINAQAAGVDALVTSGGTKVTIASKTRRDGASKIRVLQEFTAIFMEESGSPVNRTSGSAGSTHPWANNGYDAYFGHDTAMFNTIFWNGSASGTILPLFEYWNTLSASWTALGVNDETFGFQQPGVITFLAPPRWGKVTYQGITAFWIRVTRQQASMVTAPFCSALRISHANTQFQFPQTEAVGASADYTMNRFVGQIQLAQPLVSGDIVTMGSLKTRAFVISTAGNFAGLAGTTLTVLVDGVSRTVTFASGDFNNPADATSAEVAAAITARLLGVTASTVESGTKVRIQTNRATSGSLQVSSGGANSILSFSTALVTDFVSHVPALESGSQGPWTFAASSTLIVIVDSNFAASFTVPLFRESKCQAGGDSQHVVDSGLTAVFPNDTDLVGLDLLITSGAGAGQRNAIIGYDHLTGTIHIGSNMSPVPATNDLYQVIPKTVAQVVAFISNKQVTLLSTKVEIVASDAGRRLQLASFTTSEDGAIQVSGGTANSLLLFPSLAHGTDGYRYYNGLAQITQWTIDGKADDTTNYPGLRAAGVQVEVIDAVTIPVAISIQITTEQGVSLATISGNIKSAISSYVNALKVGDDVILSEIVVAAKGVSGVFDAVINSPAVNIAIADNEQARVTNDALAVT